MWSLGNRRLRNQEAAALRRNHGRGAPYNLKRNLAGFALTMRVES